MSGQHAQPRRGCLVRAATKRCAALSGTKPSLTFSPQISVVHETFSPFDYDRSSFVPVTYSCDKCGATILTFRYHCQKHNDYDVCHSCFVSKKKLCGFPRSRFLQFDPDSEDDEDATPGTDDDPNVKLKFGESPASSPTSDDGANSAESRPKKRRRPKKLNRGARKQEALAAKKHKSSPKS